jgi:hypothetical protein
MQAENQAPEARFKVLRWIAVLPGAILSLAIGSVLIRIVVLVARFFAASDGDSYSGPMVWLLTSLPLETLEVLCEAFFMPLIAIIAAAKIAPAYKFPTGIGIGLLWAPLWAILIFFIASNNRLDWDGIRLVVTLLFGVLGIVAGLVYVYKEQITLDNGDNSSLGALQGIIGASVVVALFGFGIYNAVFKEKVQVKTVEMYCSTRGNKSPHVQYDHEAIKNDLVKMVHDDLVKNFMDGEMSPDSPVVAELIRLQMLGAWRDGNHLHFADQIGITPNNDDEGAFRDWHSRLEDTLKPKGEGAAGNCLGNTINSLFDDVTLHGPGDRTAVIKITR